MCIRDRLNAKSNRYSSMSPTSSSPSVQCPADQPSLVPAVKKLDGHAAHIHQFESSFRQSPGDIHGLRATKQTEAAQFNYDNHKKVRNQRLKERDDRLLSERDIEKAKTNRRHIEQIRESMRSAALIDSHPGTTESPGADDEPKASLTETQLKAFGTNPAEAHRSELEEFVSSADPTVVDLVARVMRINACNPDDAEACVKKTRRVADAWLSNYTSA
eukprot:TRINITY_DN40936_c0_g1_i1.p1 TRINITY_DN40936_c0_g1~~TRINITY_DN40936_c0_g1_i1.p1  ORF type:complete len:217 (+),score=46.64 TRINITY_DN40936_c0_g1_i1:87-737(+)